MLLKYLQLFYMQKLCDVSAHVSMVTFFIHMPTFFSFTSLRTYMAFLGSTVLVSERTTSSMLEDNRQKNSHIQLLFFVCGCLENKLRL